VNQPLEKLKQLMSGQYRPYVGHRDPKDVTWTPDDGCWVEHYYFYRVNFEKVFTPFRSADVFDFIKHDMQQDEAKWGTYRQDWGCWVNSYDDRTSTHSYYFNELEKAQEFLRTYPDSYPVFETMKCSPWVRGPQR
jgi:hypothetical protein